MDRARSYESYSPITTFMSFAAGSPPTSHEPLAALRGGNAPGEQAAQRQPHRPGAGDQDIEGVGHGGRG